MKKQMVELFLDSLLYSIADNEASIKYIKTTVVSSTGTVKNVHLGCNGVMCMMEEQTSLGEFLQYKRLKAGLSIKELSRHVGVTENEVWKNELPTVIATKEYLLKLKDYLPLGDLDDNPELEQLIFNTAMNIYNTPIAKKNYKDKHKFIRKIILEHLNNQQHYDIFIRNLKNIVDTLGYQNIDQLMHNPPQTTDKIFRNDIMLTDEYVIRFMEFFMLPDMTIPTLFRKHMTKEHIQFMFNKVYIK